MLDKRSGLDKSIEKRLDNLGVFYLSQPKPIEYDPPPPKKKKYTPDLVVFDMYVENKGYFWKRDQQKMLAVKKQYPEKVFVMVFDNPNQIIQGAQPRKDGTRMTNREWAKYHGFMWFDVKGFIDYITKLMDTRLNGN